MKCYEWALERTDKPWEVESRLSELLYFQHRTKEASARTMRALRALKVPLARTHLGQLFHAAVLGIRRFLGKEPVPEGTLEILAEKLRLLDNRAELEFMASSPPGVILEAHMNTIVIAEHAPDLPVSGRAFLTHAVMCFMVGQRQRSNEYFQRALDLPSLQSDSYELGRAYNRIGGVHFWLGEIPEAETALQEAHQRLLPAAEPVELGKNINLLCSVYYLQGRFREMEQMARGACEKYRSLDDDLLIGMVVPVWALATGGQVPESFLHPTRRLDGFVLSKYGEAAGYVRLRQRRWEEASSHFLHTINRPWASTMDVALCRCWLVTTYRQAVETLPVRDGASRSRYLKLARGQLRKMISGAKRFSYLLPHAYRESGLVAALEGRNKDALSYLQRSLREADRLKTPFEAAWSRLELAKMLVAWGEEGAEAKLGQAYGELKAMGATWLLPAAAGPDTSPALHDRFEQVVRWGGQVVLRETPHEVYRDLHQASATLLRGQRSSLFLLEDPPRRLFGEAGFSKSLLSQALESGHPSSGSQNQPDSLSASLLMAGHRWALCAPIATDGKAVAFLYVTHDEVAFSSQEEKLAEYLASLAGAALDGLRAARQRRKALEALRLSEDRFAALFHSAGVGLALVDGEDHILELNPRLEEMLGSQLVGRSFAELLYHEDRRPERARLEGLIAGRVDSYVGEVRFPRADGCLAWGGITASPVPGTGMIVRSLSDISPSRLRQISEFQELERQLLSSELHDVISQPLAGLHLQLQLAETLLQRGQSEQAKSTISSTAKQAVESLSQLSGLMYSLRDPMSDGLRLFDAIAKLATQAAPLDVRLSLEGAEPEGLAALFAYRIVGESLTNVRRHSGADSVQVQIKVEEGLILGLVQDNGRGLLTDPHGSGRGLGLKGMKMRAELLGGSLSVTRVSSSGGTLVEFRLPSS